MAAFQRVSFTTLSLGRRHARARLVVKAATAAGSAGPGEAQARRT